MAKTKTVYRWEIQEKVPLSAGGPKWHGLFDVSATTRAEAKRMSGMKGPRYRAVRQNGGGKSNMRGNPYHRWEVIGENWYDTKEQAVRAGRASAERHSLDQHYKYGYRVSRSRGMWKVVYTRTVRKSPPRGNPKRKTCANRARPKCNPKRKASVRRPAKRLKSTGWMKAKAVKLTRRGGKVSVEVKR